MHVDDFILQLGTLLAAVAGFAVAIKELRRGTRQQRLELGSLYIQRYWQVDDDLLTLPKGSVEHRHARHRYLRLCEDEFEAASQAWLDAQQWELWHKWLVNNDCRSRLVSDLAACNPDGLAFENVRRCLATDANHPWRECKARRQTV